MEFQKLKKQKRYNWMEEKEIRSSKKCNKRQVCRKQREQMKEFAWMEN